MQNKNSITLVTNPISSEQLHKRLQRNIVLGLALTSLLIGITASAFLYRADARQIETSIAYQIKLESVILASKITQFKYVTQQITSRSSIRHELEKYLHGDISLQSLQDFSTPRLADAMQQTSEIIGIIRMDNKANPLIQMGTPVPESLWPKNFFADKVQIGLPGEIDGKQLLVISNPITNREGMKIGIDLVAFDFYPIVDIMENFVHHQPTTSKIRIATPTPDGVRYPYPADTTKNFTLEPLFKKEVQAIEHGETKTLHQVKNSQDNSSLIVLHYPIGDTGWIYFYVEAADILFAPARRHAVYIMLAFLSITIIGIALTLNFVRPLSRRIKEEADTTHHLLQEHDKLLNKVQLNESRLKSILDNAHSFIFIKDLEGKYLMANRFYSELLNIAEDGIINRTDYDIFPQDMANTFRKNDLRVIAENAQILLDEQARLHDGVHHYISIKFPLYDANDEIYAVGGISTDITARKHLEQREQLRLRILELMTTGEPLQIFLNKLLSLIETHIVGAIGSILLLNESGTHLRLGAAHGLPDYVLEACKDLEVKEGNACCGTAVYTNKPVFIDNIQQHPFWQSFREIAIRANLVACWSEPIRDSQGKVLGTFALYFRKQRSPTAAEIKMLNQIAQLTGIAIENKANEKALHDSEERFEYAMRAANDGVMDWDLSTSKVYYSARWKAMFGYEENELLHELSTWENLVDEQDKISTMREVESCIAGNQSGFVARNRLRHKDGHWVDVLVRCVMIRDADGQAERLVCTYSDISEQIAAEVALKNSETRMRSMFEFAQDGILLMDLNTHELLDANPSWCRMLGYNCNELTTLRAEDIFPAESLSESMAKFELSISGKSKALVEDLPILRKDGRVFPADINISLIEIDKRQCMLKFFRDITGRKDSEDQLEAYRDELEAEVIVRTRELEELTLYNRTLFETSATGMVLNDMQGKMVDANPAYLKIIGYTEAEARDLSYWDLIPIEFAEQEETLIAALNYTGLYGPYTKEYIHKDGHRVTVRLNGLIIKQNDENFIWSSVEDITERITIEREMLDAKQKAEAAVQAKSEFLANMSHEIRTPLNAVLGLAKMGSRGTSAKKAQEIFELIADSGQNLFRVVNDILDFSKMEVGKLSLENHSFNLRHSVNNVSNLIRNQVDGKGLSFILELDDDVPVWVKGDALRLEQILLNFLSNAIKFTATGFVKLRVLMLDKSIQFQVCDSGIGMSEEELSKLFTPFEQADNSTTRLYGGTGLGLSISHNLALMMGGDIQVESHPGKGSSFFLNLTLEPTEPVIAPEKAQFSDTDQRLSNINILVAEDIELNRLVVEDMLQTEGAQVTFAYNGQQAIDLLKERGETAFDVILMDIQMPVMDGHTATQIIHKTSPDLPIIGLTAHALAAEKAHCIKSGMVDHVAKPVDINELVASIQKHVLLKRKNTNLTHNNTAATTDNSAPQMSLPHEADAIIDWPALRLRFQGRDASVIRLLTTAIRTQGDTAEKIRDAVNASDAETLRFIAHSLKSMSGFLEAGTLCALAGQIEEDIDKNNLFDAQVGMKLATAIDDLLSTIKATIN